MIKRNVFQSWDNIIQCLKMSNGKLENIQLEAVSKCKKQKLNNPRKLDSIKLSSNIHLVADLDDEYGEPEIQHDINFLSKVRDRGALYQLRDFEDSNLTKHIAEQLIIIKIMMMIMAVLSIMLARFGENSEDLTMYGINGEVIVLITHSILTAAIVMAMIMKHLKTRQLVIKQLIKFSSYQLNLGGITPIFIVELVFLMIHPNLLLKDKYLSLKEPIYEHYMKVYTNNIMEIFMLGRIYLVYSAIVSSTIYLSTRGSRICRIYGTKCNLYFGFKCLFNTRPLFFLVVIFITMLFVFGEMVRLSEEDVPSSTLGIFGNSLWCVMITMGTVGYGDYYPQTYLGRVILFFAAITGIIVASLLILTLSTYLSMKMSENKAHITMHRLVLRDKMEELARGVMHKTALLSKLQSNQSQQQIKGLKKQTEDVKYTLRKIKNLIDTDNINEEMDRLFESLEDNMKDAYLNQIRYAEALQILHEVEAEKINEMKFSFTEEIENVIKDR